MSCMQMMNTWHIFPSCSFTVSTCSCLQTPGVGATSINKPHIIVELLSQYFPAAAVNRTCTSCNFQTEQILHGAVSGNLLVLPCRAKHDCFRFCPNTTNCNNKYWACCRKAAQDLVLFLSIQGKTTNLEKVRYWNVASASSSLAICTYIPLAKFFQVVPDGYMSVQCIE